jgi:hypothetical protein
LIDFLISPGKAGFKTIPPSLRPSSLSPNRKKKQSSSSSSSSSSPADESHKTKKKKSHNPRDLDGSGFLNHVGRCRTKKKKETRRCRW